MQNLTTLPLDGATAPRNTKLWQLAAADEVGEFSLVNAQGAAVALRRSTITVSGEETVDLEILTPVSPLEAGAWVFSRGGTVLSRFTASDVVDGTAPLALAPTVSSVEGAYFGSWSCGQPSMATLALGAEAEVAIGLAWPLALLALLRRRRPLSPAASSALMLEGISIRS